MLRANSLKMTGNEPQPSELNGGASAMPDFFADDVAYEEKVNIGSDYQAEIPPYTVVADAVDKNAEPQEEVVFMPSKVDNELLLERYLSAAQDERQLTIDQALVILDAFQYNIAEATSRLSMYESADRAWTDHELQIFNLAVDLYGDNFQCIKQMLPGRSYAEIIDHHHDYEASKLYLGDSQSERVIPSTSKASGGCHNLMQLVKQAIVEGGLTDKKHELGKSTVLRGETMLKAKQLAIAELSKEVKALRDEAPDFGNAAHPCKLTRKWDMMDVDIFNVSLREYGHDYEEIAEILGTKTPEQVAEYAKQRAWQTAKESKQLSNKKAATKNIKNTMTQQGAVGFGTLTGQWKPNEEVAIKGSLQKHGHAYDDIAEMLDTKSAEEVTEHANKRAWQTSRDSASKKPKLMLAKGERKGALEINLNLYKAE